MNEHRLTRPDPQAVANGFSIELSVDELWSALENSYKEIDKLKEELSRWKARAIAAEDTLELGSAWEIVQPNKDLKEDI